MANLLDWVKKAARRTLDARPTLAASMTNPGDGSDAPASPSPHTAEVAERYENLGEVARGGMGSIVKVYDRGLRRTLAMKVLDPSDGEPQKYDSTFVEEAQITGQLDHPNICPIHDIGRDSGSGTSFFTMKLVKGKTLADIIHAPDYDPASPRSIRDALDVLRKVCDALAFAHSRGVLHRDLKPENIMVGAFGQVYLMDWGVARVLPDHADDERVTVSRTGPAMADQPGAIVGTLMYMAPEQARGELANVTVRSDVFGLGAILYEILTQVPPFWGQDLGEILQKAQGGRYRAPQELCGDDIALPSALCAICEKALSARPEDRYATVEEVRDALDAFLVGGLSFPTRVFAPGECVVSQGEMGETAFIIQRGYCRVYKLVKDEMMPLTDLGPGDVFGETAVFAQSPRTATVQALTDVTVQVVSKDVFEKDLGMASAMGAFVRALAARFVQTSDQLRALQESASPAALATPSEPAPASEAPAKAAPAPTPAIVTPPPPLLAPLGAGGPLALMNAVVRLQTLARSPDEVGSLLVEAIARGVDDLVRARQ